MQWTTTAPTEAGWYWARDEMAANAVPTMFYVQPLAAGAPGGHPRIVAWSTKSAAWTTRVQGTEWAGPIDTPGEGG